MRRTKQSRTTLPTGSSRLIDYALEDVSVGAVMGATGLVNSVRNQRSGVIESAQLTISSAVYNYYQGRRVVAINTGINNGFQWLKGIVVATVRPTKFGSLALRGPRVARLFCSQTCETITPNADMGTNVIVSTVGGITDLYTANGTGPNKSGFGVQMIGSKWQFTNKHQGLASGQFTELVDLGIVNDGALIDTEFRIFDATLAQEARLEVWVLGLLRVTRYWLNPPGVATPTLPPFNVTGCGSQLWLQHRNTSIATGPVYIADSGVIVGTNDSGTI